MFKVVDRGISFVKDKAVKFLAVVGVVSTVVVSAVVGFVKPAAAAVDLSDFEIDLTSIETIVPIILIGGAAMWVIRKLTKTVNKT